MPSSTVRTLAAKFREHQDSSALCTTGLTHTNMRVLESALSESCTKKKREIKKKKSFSFQQEDQSLFCTTEANLAASGLVGETRTRHGKEWRANVSPGGTNVC